MYDYWDYTIETVKALSLTALLRVYARLFLIYVESWRFVTDEQDCFVVLLVSVEARVTTLSDYYLPLQRNGLAVLF